MTQDWRLQITLPDAASARELMRRLGRSERDHDLSRAFDQRVVVSRDGGEVFCYAGTRDQADAAERLIRALADEHGWQVTLVLTRWHPDAEEWEDAAAPLPSTEAERAAERAELMEQERRQSARQGYPEFEVRVRCHSRHDAAALVRKLRGEGLAIVHRGEFVLLGAGDEDAADALAERIRREAPTGSQVTAEASIREVTGETPLASPFSPFAVFGGLGG